MSNKTHVIYILTCDITGKRYIGQTNDFAARMRGHRSKTSGCRALRRAIEKHGWEAFSSSIVLDNLSLDEANLREEQYIRRYQTVAPDGYNLNAGGLNKIPSPETRQLHREANLRRGARPPSRLETTNTPESNTKRSKSNVGKHSRIRTDAERLKQSATNVVRGVRPPSRKGIPSTKKGVPMSMEQRAKLCKPKPVVQCDICGKVGSASNMPRYHFQNCKHITKQSLQ